jgi:hypothetical protein
MSSPPTAPKQESPLDLAILDAAVDICIIGHHINRRGTLTLPESQALRRQFRDLHSLLTQVESVIKSENINEYRKRLYQRTTPAQAVRHEAPAAQSKSAATGPSNPQRDRL